MNIIHSDFFVSTLFDVVSPIELFSLRLISPYLYEHIRMKEIENLIILKVYQRLKDVNILNIIDKYKVCIYGPIVNEVIWGEYNDNTYMDLKMRYDQVGTKENNIFIDLGMRPYEYCRVDSWMYHAMEYTLMLGKIRLCITHDEWKEEKQHRYEMFPTIFRNTICDHQLTLTNISDLIHKKYKKIDYYHTYDFHDQETEEYLCEKYLIQAIEIT